MAAFFDRTRTFGAPAILVALLAGAALVQASLYLLFSADLPEEPARALPRPYLRYTGELESNAAERLRQEAALYDSAPLFVPTAWNAATRPPLPRQETPAASLFEPFGARLSLSGESLRPTPPVPPAQVADELLQTPYAGMAPLATLGQRARPILPLPEGDRSGELTARIYPAGEETALLVRRVILPEGEGPGEALWEPALFRLDVGPLEAVRQPVLERSSGLPALDRALAAALGRPWFSADLPAGYYRVQVGP